MPSDPAYPATRRYRGFIADTARWERFAFRPDDVVISTPAKCGTTWMQTIVGMLLLDRVDFGAPIATISPWLDMLTRSDDEVFGLLDAQTHRRFIKTHAPLDGIPRHDPVTYIAVVRHPLDVALSDRDHNENQREDRLVELRLAASGEPDPDLPVGEDRPEDTGDYLRWFIDNHEPPVGSGPHGLEDYCQQVRTYWDAREAANVHLFHYADMWADLDGEMRRVAAALGVPVDETPVAGVRRGGRARLDAIAGGPHHPRGARGYLGLARAVLPLRAALAIGRPSSAATTWRTSRSGCRISPATRRAGRRAVGRARGRPDTDARWWNPADRPRWGPLPGRDASGRGRPSARARPASSNARPDPAVRSFTVGETSTSEGPAWAPTRAPIATAESGHVVAVQLDLAGVQAGPDLDARAYAPPRRSPCAHRVRPGPVRRTWRGTRRPSC